MASSSSSHSNIIQFPRMSSHSWDLNANTALPPYPNPPRHSRTLKESSSTESLTQRKDRVEFLRHREWTRRAAAGGDQPNIPRTRARTNSWEEIIAAADAAASTFDYNSSGYAGRSPGAFDEVEESDEPYVIYTASPRPHPQSALPSPYTYFPHTPGTTLIYSTSPPSTPSPPPIVSPLPSPPVRDMSVIGSGVPYYGRRASWRGPHSRHSSLSSISEEDEGLGRL